MVELKSELLVAVTVGLTVELEIVSDQVSVLLLIDVDSTGGGQGQTL